MTNVIGFAVATKNARANAIKTAIDSGTAGSIKFYTGTRPATADTALSGNTLLGTLTFTAPPSAPAASSGVLTFSAITTANAVATGTATFARIADSAGTTIFDCDVGTSGAVINLNTTAIVSGGPIVITSFTITEA